MFGPTLYAALLLISAGILIGYLLWHGDTAAAKKTIEELQVRYAKARQAARQRRLDRLAAEKRVEGLESLARRNQSQIIELQQASLAKRRQFEGEKKRADSLVAQMREVLQDRAAGELLLSQTAEELEHVRQANVELKLQCDSLRAELATAVSADATPAALQAIDRLESQLQQRTRELDECRADRDAISQEYQQTIERTAMLESELAVAAETDARFEEVCRELDSAAQSLSGQREILENQQRDLRHAHDAREHEQSVTRDAIARRDQQIERLQQQVHDLLPLRAEVIDAQIDLAELRMDAAEKSQLDGQDELRRQAELETMRAALVSHDFVKGELSDTVTKLSEATKLCHDLRDRWEAAQEELSQRRLFHERQDAEIARLRADLLRLQRSPGGEGDANGEGPETRRAA